jgi:hypothetical protein
MINSSHALVKGVLVLAVLATAEAYGALPKPTLHATLSSETSAAKQCSADAEPGSAQADAPYFPAGGAYGARWGNWNEGIQTCVPWLMPSDDKELAASSRMHGPTTSLYGPVARPRASSPW